MARRYNKSFYGRNRIASNMTGMPSEFKRPFWLPAISYYFLTVAVAIVVFFLIWGILLEGGDETPWIPAGLISSSILIGAVFLREITLRNARKKYLIAKRQLDYNLNKIQKTSVNPPKRPKFTLQQNSTILNQIKEKSDAARVLKRLPEGHLEVFELCNEYLNFTIKELRTVVANSPRFIAIRKGRKSIKRIHKYHLLKWAEIESRKYTREAKNLIKVGEKVETAQKAQAVLQSALSFYPNELNLVESAEAVDEYISRIKISHRIEEAEKSEFKGNLKQAKEKYEDTLFLLSKEKINKKDKELFEETIKLEILRIEELIGENNNFVNQPDKLKEINND